MKRSLQSSSTQSDQSTRIRLSDRFDLFRTASSQRLARAAIAVEVAWVLA